MDIIKPDLVITLLGVNDLTWHGRPGYKTRYVHESDYATDAPPLARQFADKCMNASQLCRRMAKAWEVVATDIKRARGSVVSWNSTALPSMQRAYRELPYVDAAHRSPDPIEELRGGMSWLLQFLKERDIETIVLGQPVLWTPDLGREEYHSLWFSVATPDGPVRPSLTWLAKEMAKYNEIQKEEASKRNFAYLGLDAEMPKSRDFFVDDCHFTDKGSAHLARLILPVLDRVLRSRGHMAGDRFAGIALEY